LVPFDMGKSLGWSTVTISGGKATYSPFDRVLVDGLAIPRKILFESGGGAQPWLTMGIELVDNTRPECTFLQLDSDGASPVRDKHIKLIHVEKWVSQIVMACSDEVEEQSTTSSKIIHGPLTSDRARAIERMQSRRNDPKDRELLEQVAAIYKDNPDKPIKAILRAFPHWSESKAKRLARRCSDADLLPTVSKRGQKRI
jgi:hypothetical protein